MNQEGKLNPEQFALAMWLINRKQAGKDPPAALTPDMVPPSLRPKGQDAVRYFGLIIVLFYSRFIHICIMNKKFPIATACFY